MERDSSAYESEDQAQYLNVNHLSETEKPLGLRIHVFFLTVSFGIILQPSLVISLDFKDTLTWSESSMLVIRASIIGEILSLAISVGESGNY